MKAAERYGVTPAGLQDLGVVHMIGIAGSGMSVVAELLHAAGITVRGSDHASPEAVAELTEVGIRVFTDHAPENVDGADTIIITGAIWESNPELVAARERGLLILHRSQALSLLMHERRGIAVAGTHGKTTTTAMVAAALASAGLDPSYAVGGPVMREIDGELVSTPGGHMGQGDTIVVEADESDRSFLNYGPSIAVVTNVEPDHMDYYADAEEFHQAFVDFAGTIRPGGWLVACWDDPGSRKLAVEASVAGIQVLTYGTASEADIVIAIDPIPETIGTRVTVDVGEGAWRQDIPDRHPFTAVTTVIDLQVPGEHNALNAAAAVCVALTLGASAEDAGVGLSQFRGAHQRFQLRATVGGIRVIDDYAHHPTEIEALMTAARPVAGAGKIHAIFRAHLHSRVMAFLPEFARALAKADDVVVTEIRQDREIPMSGVSSQTIVDDMVRQGIGDHAVAIEDREEAARTIARNAQPGDIILVVGSGDALAATDVIVDELRLRWP